MTVAYADVRRFVQHLGPTWRKTQHENCARLVHALLERPSLCLSDLARAMSPAAGPLHGRIKRLERFLSNPRLDEPALFVRWLKLTYHFSDGPEPAPGERPILPLLLDTVYFEPYALLVISVPCGSRGLPVAPCTYHRRDLQACLAPKATWPSGDEPFPPRPRRRRNGPGNSGAPSPQIELKTYLSQNEIEAELIERVFILLCPSLRGVIVADRGFARASLFCELRQQERDFVIRIDAQTHIGLPQPLAPDRAKEGTPAQVLNLQPGQRIWCPQAWYSKEERVPISLLAVWDVGQEEPWYIATVDSV